MRLVMGYRMNLKNALFDSAVAEICSLRGFEGVTWTKARPEPRLPVDRTAVEGLGKKSNRGQSAYRTLLVLARWKEQEERKRLRRRNDG